jgi:hypothetical protein
VTSGQDPNHYFLNEMKGMDCDEGDNVIMREAFADFCLKTRPTTRISPSSYFIPFI